MKRVGALVAVLVVAVGTVSTVAGAADSVRGYTQAGEWFSAGEGHGSSYDNTCARWFDNNFAKGSHYWGLITYIDASGGWNYSVQGFGALARTLSGSNLNWAKKLHCKNNSGSVYQGGCWGQIRTFQCA